MRTTPIRWLLRAAPLALLIGSGALAANDTKSEGASADIPFTKQANMTPQETLAQSKEYVSKMQDTLRRITELQEVAKKQKDIIKLNCVNDKLLQTKGHIAVNDQAMSSLNEAIARNDAPSRQHEFSRVTILYQKVLVLGTEAENCIGEDLSYIGAARVDVEIDPGIPQQDVTDPGYPQLDISRPPLASAPL
jgi:hypothetical protein